MLTTLNAGGKFGGGGYRISGGLHGVGVSVVNALSERDDRRRQARRLHVAPGLRAGPRHEKLMKGKPTTKTGTTITLLARPRDLRGGIEFKRETLAERLRELAFLNAGIEIQLIDEREGCPQETFKSNGGLVGLREAPRRRQGAILTG